MFELLKIASTRGMRRRRVSGSAGCCRHGASWLAPKITGLAPIWSAAFWPWT